MVRQQTPLLKRLIIGSVLSGLLFGFGGFIANTPTLHLQPVSISIHQPGGSTSLQERLYAQIPDPYSDPDVIEQLRSGE
ncbi:MAG TPA: hypothetical protein VGN34_27950 [Ktedonobacteraceae bacterium]|jgi:hypothetical protein